jgi:hypothetical protein
MLDMAGHEYYVRGTGSDDSRGSERISRGSAGLTLRLYGRHALGAQYLLSNREARYGSISVREQTEGTVSFVYTFLGDNHFGAVEWRDPEDH